MDKPEHLQIPPWLWAIAISLVIQVVGAIWVTAMFTGKFEEFRLSVNQRLDRI